MITAKQSERQFEIPPAGNHLAICYQMIEIGTEKGQYMGQPKENYNCRIVWELPNERKIFDPEKGEQPHIIGRDYTLSMGEKANLRHHVDSWRGKALTDEEAQKFDITVLLGKPCMLNVIHGTTKVGKQFAKVASIAPVPKGMAIPPQTNPSFVFSYDDEWDDKKFAGLPEWLRKRIEATPQFGVRLDKMPIQGEEPPFKDDDDSDGLPF